MKKNWLVLMLILCMLVGCETKEAEVVPTPEQKDTLKIGMIFDTFVVERWQNDRDIFVSHAKELGAEVDVQNANGDANSQVEHMEYFIEQGVDVIVIVPIESNALLKTIKKAKEAGIPVISYDRLVVNGETDLYISFDNERVGELMGEAIRQQLKSYSSVYMISGPKSDNNVSMVNLGFQNQLENSTILIRDIFYTEGWKAENAYDYLQGEKEELSQIQGIMCGNDNIAGLVVKALSEQQLAGTITVVGQDADLDACQRIVEGTQYMTVYKPYEELASIAAEAAVLLAKDEEVPTDDTIMDGTYHVPYIKIEPIPVTIDNMNEVIVESGFHLKEDVYLNRPDLMP